MKVSRRGALKRLLAGSAIFLVPVSALAKWAEKAFNATKLDEAIKILWPDATLEKSDKVRLKAPEIAENGAVVPVTIASDLPNVKSMAIFVEKNPSPLTSKFDLFKDTKPEFSLRIRMGETSKVIAAVETTDGKVYYTEKEVKVTIGGCGG